MAQRVRMWSGRWGVPHPRGGPPGRPGACACFRSAFSAIKRRTLSGLLAGGSAARLRASMAQACVHGGTPRIWSRATRATGAWSRCRPALAPQRTPEEMPVARATLEEPHALHSAVVLPDRRVVHHTNPAACTRGVRRHALFSAAAHRLPLGARRLGGGCGSAGTHSPGAMPSTGPKNATWPAWPSTMTRSPISIAGAGHVRPPPRRSARLGPSAKRTKGFASTCALLRGSIKFQSNSPGMESSRARAARGGGFCCPGLG